MAKPVLEVKRQGHDGQALRAERGDGGGQRKREHRPAQKIDRQQRRGELELPPDERDAARGADGDFNQRQRGDSPLTDPVDAGDDESESERVEEHAQKIEAPGGARRCGQRPRRHHQSQDAKRHVDEKQPMPGGDRKDRRGDARASGHANGDHHRHVADPLAKPCVRIDEANERDADAHDSRRAQALNNARDGEHGECRRERAGERGDGEERKPPPIDAPVAEPVAKRGQRQKGYGDRELEGVDDPDRVLRRDGELARHRWQSDRDNGPVEHRHAGPHGERRERQQALRIGEAVLRFDGVRRGYRLSPVQGRLRSTGVRFATLKPPCPINRRRRSARS